MITNVLVEPDLISIFIVSSLCFPRPKFIWLKVIGANDPLILGFLAGGASRLA